jgi:Fe2+ transport system protein B
MAKITIPLAGHPNSGKSSIFNHLAGARQPGGKLFGRYHREKGRRL